MMEQGLLGLKYLEQSLLEQSLLEQSLLEQSLLEQKLSCHWHDEECSCLFHSFHFLNGIL
jgi:hypothetical protein